MWVEVNFVHTEWIAWNKRESGIIQYSSCPLYKKIEKNKHNCWCHMEQDYEHSDLGRSS